MATIWASLNRPFFIYQSSGSESYGFLYSLLAHFLGKRTAPLQSSRHAPGAKVNVLDMLSTDRTDPAVAPATAEAATAADSEPAEPEAAGEATVPQAIYSNPLTEATRTRNDEANRKAAAELRKSNRAALRIGTDSQKAALTALIKEGSA
ncbi:hypothetical protein FY528_19535 [Hymenobacter lutimineralis]|uniref:Uncharacterized protein n=2 Tax=Hymenobacter lutimineralis TaxID=2606448 RepID=A0A5D6UST3_9BACT|nr:hypothetical protein FY528_19535 [Hymenobacter lutimineralis]